LTGPESAPSYSATRFAEFLVAPDAGEQLSPIDGPGCLILDLSDDSRPLSQSARARIVAALPILPCVTIALVSDATDDAMNAADRFELRSLASICDVRVATRAACDEILSGFERTPLAALAFVQLLRSGSSTSSYAGLVAESFVYSTLQAGPEFARWRSMRRPKKSRSAAPGPACRVERDRGRLEITLARPDKRNAFSREMRDSITEALHLLSADPSIEEVVLRGEGPSFCSGGDLDEFGSLPDPAQAHAIRTTRSPALLLAQWKGHVRAEVHGACVGAGVELPAFADHVVADEDAFFALPEVSLGLIPGAGGTVSLPRRIGRQRTAWLGLSGNRIDAGTALDWGLVDEVRLGQHPDDV
jgi:enoyl-CoA hydratase